LIYKKGEDVAQDFKEAFKWFKLAAEQGDAKAQNNLGLMYYEGQDVTSGSGLVMRRLVIDDKGN